VKKKSRERNYLAGEVEEFATLLQRSVLKVESREGGTKGDKITSNRRRRCVVLERI